MTELHQKYAPILRYNKGEQFFPMRADDLLKYSSLYAKGNDKPLVPEGKVAPADLVKHGGSAETFVRTITAGPLTGENVVDAWGSDTLEMVLRWADESTPNWTSDLAQSAYSWFSAKTQQAAQLFWWNDMVSNVVKGEVESVSAGELPRLVLPVETQNSAIQRYKTASPGYAYYYREVKDGNYLCLQYWFFYAYNNWGRGFMGLNDHEGDWECMLLFFELDGGHPKEPPAYVTYADHESRQTKPWHEAQKTGNHPIGFVGAGSHATYPKAETHTLMAAYNLVDRATGDGVTIDHDDWAHRVNLDDASWLGSYKGSWGTRFWLSTSKAKAALQIALAATPLAGIVGLTVTSREVELPGVSAPRGPVNPHRAQYATPVEWAGVPLKE